MKKLSYTLFVGILLSSSSFGYSLNSHPKPDNSNMKLAQVDDTLNSNYDAEFVLKELEDIGNNIKKDYKISVEGKLMTAVEVLSNYIQHKSISYNEKYAGEWLRNICEDNGLIINQFGDENGNYNFSGSLYPLSDSLPNVIFLNHIDVVDEGDSTLWTKPPFSGYISDTEIWGRGAFDNKGAAIMQLFSILQFKSKNYKSDLPFNVTFLSVSCEETMCDGGVKYVIENYLQDLNPVVVIGEGATELSDIINSKSENPVFGISIAHKRPLWIKLGITIPTSGHGSVTPLMYANKELTIALSRLVKKKSKIRFTPQNKEILKCMGDQEKGIKKFIFKNPGLFKFIVVQQIRKQPEFCALFTNTITLTGLNSYNETVNIIPNSVVATLDCRLLPRYSNEKFIKYINKRLDNKNIKLSIITKTQAMEPSDPDSQLYHNLKNAVTATFPGSNVLPIILPNFNDLGSFRSRGVNCYSIIPVKLDVKYLKCIHGVDERIPIHILDQGITTYMVFIENCMNSGNNGLNLFVCQ